MSRLPLIDARTMEKILYHLGFEKVRQKEAMRFTDMPMAERPQSLSTQTKALHVPLLGLF
jgi:hypothetical protein